MVMAKICLIVVLLGCVCAAVACPQMHNTSFRAWDYELDKQVIKTVPCTLEADKLHNQAIDEVACGTPKYVYIELKPPTRFEKVTPSAVWVKRCIGSCQLDSLDPNAQCAPINNARSVNTNIFNVKTGQQRCAAYEIEEHTACACPSGEE